MGKIVARVRYRKRKKPSGMSPSSGGFTCAIHPPHKKPATYMGCSEDRWDQSPLVQCSRCLGFGHKEILPRKADKCALWRRPPVFVPARKTPSPRCINCTRAGCEDVAHRHSARGVRAKWDRIARTKVAYC
ncbi:hypothetical protein EVAR_65719_1 [Eumeta japonica]|uniref:Uncharacterized protein n=1 Tax=Eumeta variegata TaxID=151549 RepID=A0A4C2AB49_EUMVA|nr:hypothetical protein EVAR_65719_1 [Eumeta japonica]